MNMNRFKYKYRRLIEKGAVVFSDDQLSTRDVRNVINFIADEANSGEEKETLLTAVFMQDSITLDKAVLSKREIRHVERDLEAMGFMKHSGADGYVKKPEEN